jgi:hypothetical protein
MDDDLRVRWIFVSFRGVPTDRTHASYTSRGNAAERGQNARQLSDADVAAPYFPFLAELT